jgi:hypothetical protein
MTIDKSELIETVIDRHGDTENVHSWVRFAAEHPSAFIANVDWYPEDLLIDFLIDGLVQWIESDLSAENARAYMVGNPFILTPDLVQAWIDSDYAPEDAEPWLSAGALDPDSADQLASAGMTPEQAEARLSNRQLQETGRIGTIKNKLDDLAPRTAAFLLHRNIVSIEDLRDMDLE